jgi:hypothetical protein
MFRRLCETECAPRATALERGGPELTRATQTGGGSTGSHAPHHGSPRPPPEKNVGGGGTTCQLPRCFPSIPVTTWFGASLQRNRQGRLPGGDLDGPQGSGHDNQGLCIFQSGEQIRMAGVGADVGEIPEFRLRPTLRGFPSVQPRPPVAYVLSATGPIHSELARVPHRFCAPSAPGGLRVANSCGEPTGSRTNRAWNRSVYKTKMGRSRRISPTPTRPSDSRLHPTASSSSAETFPSSRTP